MLLGVLLFAMGAVPGTAASRCAVGCRAVEDAELRARACGACVLANDRAAWVEALARASGTALRPRVDAALEAALHAPDWRICQAALSARAGVSVARALIDYVVREPDRGAWLAAHVAGERGQAARALEQEWAGEGRAGARAAAALHERASSVRAALEVELYEEDPLVRSEALRHASAYFEESPARVVLTALHTRPASADPAVAELLFDTLSDAKEPVGRVLAAEATPERAPEVDRLLAAYAARLDRTRAALHDADPLRREAAVADVGRLAPMSAPELTHALDDGDGRVRRMALRWLARGEGRTVGELVDLRVRANATPGPDAWLGALGESGAEDCGAIARALVGDLTVPAASRGAALTAWVSCDGARAWPHVRASLTDPAPEVRAGAVAASALLPRLPEAAEAAERAMRDPSAVVVAAAARAAGQPGQGRRIPKLLALLADDSPSVRLAAADALARIGRLECTPALARRLEEERDVTVRRGVVRALQRLGGGQAMVALGKAAQFDPDEGIRSAAREASSADAH
jgi:HEAT repeat protein